MVNAGDGSPHGGLTISVNTNWFNGFNLEKVSAFLLSELLAVRGALDHLRESMSRGVGRVDQSAAGKDGTARDDDGGGDSGGSSGSGGRGSREWEHQCELVMRANSALNMTEFARIVMARARYLLSLPSSECPGPGPGPPFRAQALSPPAAATDYAESDSGDLGGGGGDSWKEERWKVLALEQIGAVLRDLLVAPCADHIFLGDGGEAGASEENELRIGGGGSLRETLAAVEAYLLGGGKSVA